MAALVCVVAACSIALLAQAQPARADNSPGHVWWADRFAADEPPPWDDASDATWASSWSSGESFSDGTADEAPPADQPPADQPPADLAPAADGSTDDALLLTPDALVAADTTLAADVRDAPTLTATGTTLSWTPSADADSYVFVRKVPGLPDQYSIVSGTSATPPAVPGQTVTYSIRANVAGSDWAPETTIAYPDSAAGDDPAVTLAATVATTAAPTMSVSGSTVRWSRVGSVATYVFARKVPGQATQYSLVTGTSATPAAVPGQTVSYGVRTNVSGSAWATEVSIKYAGTSTPTPPPPSSDPTPQPIDGSFQMGVVSGSALSYELPFIKALGAHTARLDFAIGSSVSSMGSVIDQYSRAGIKPLLLASFNKRLPTAAEAQNLAKWADAFGPGGSFRQDKGYPVDTAVTDIEFGNETSYSYQFADYSLSTYSSRAQTYAQRAKEAAVAIRGGNTKVGLLAIGDNAVNQTAWVANMLKAVPNLDDLVAGWTVHPYGPNWATRIDSTINSAKAAGARDIPIWITEWGLASDNGRCLDDNYGFDKCMTYASAASTLHSTLAALKSRYGSRLGAFYLYQANDLYVAGSRTSREAYFGALQNGGATKGAYTTEVKADLAAN